MKILVLGLTQHGKDETAKILSRKYGLKFVSSSEAALDYIFPVLKQAKGYQNKKEAFEDRNNGNQMLWKEGITLLNTPDKTTLVHEIIDDDKIGCDIYVGMRCYEEYSETHGLFDWVLWVDASVRVPAAKVNSMTIPFRSVDMLLIDNNGTLEDLEREIDMAAVKMGLAEDPAEVSIRDLIVNWADSVLPQRTIKNAIDKMVLEEIPEYLLAQKDPMELADLGILIYDIAHLAGIDLDAAIRQKMEINKKRSWEFSKETGLMSHKKGDK